MVESNNRSWDEAINALHQAADALKSVLSRMASRAEEKYPASSQLKGDLERLQRAGSELQTKLLDGFEQQRPEIVSNLDRERAERTAEQLKGSFEEFASLAVDVSTRVTAAAQNSLKQAEPELRTAVQSLEDLASSVAAWLARSIHSEEGDRRPEEPRRPPLDEL